MLPYLPLNNTMAVALTDFWLSQLSYHTILTVFVFVQYTVQYYLTSVRRSLGLRS